jgi:hypothetical protein
MGKSRFLGQSLAIIISVYDLWAITLSSCSNFVHMICKLLFDMNFAIDPLLEEKCAPSTETRGVEKLKLYPLAE